MKRALPFALLVLLAGCGRDQSAPVTTTSTPAAEPTHPAFVGKVWMSSTPGAALGSMIIFLPDRTLVMDSCFETYRLTKWGVAGERIRWIEDTIPVEADVEMPHPNQLILSISGLDRKQTYFTAAVPYTCPQRGG
jgi:hypothetical protein